MKTRKYKLQNNKTKKNKHLLPIMNPIFNLREIAIQLLLLEDHLFQKGKRCCDCILKHIYTIEGLLDEGISLDKKMKYFKLFQNIQKKFYNIAKILEPAVKNKHLTDDICISSAQKLRKIRKPLVKMTAGLINKY